MTVSMDSDGTSAGAKAHKRRRWVYRAGVAVALVVLAGALWWYAWVPSYRPSLGEGERYGVDVSNHQGEIDWEAVAADDIDFAFIKSTEGQDFVDRQFERNWASSETAGVERGAYHFFTLCRPGAAQAENFLATVPPDADALPPAIDLELAGNCSDRPSREWVDRELGTFIDEVESEAGQEVVLYIGADFQSRYPIRDELQRPIWHRRILLHPDIDSWWIWQFNYRASVDGIDGGVDLNIMRG